eukprot:scaffold56474_cov63-Phaeocystis_antarctica.AAC.2
MKVASAFGIAGCTARQNSIRSSASACAAGQTTLPITRWRHHADLGARASIRQEAPYRVHVAACERGLHFAARRVERPRLSQCTAWLLVRAPRARASLAKGDAQRRPTLCAAPPSPCSPRYRAAVLSTAPAKQVIHVHLSLLPRAFSSLPCRREVHLAAKIRATDDDAVRVASSPWR